MTSNPAGIKAVDSLSAYEFQVEINGQVVNGVFGVKGLSSFVLDGEYPPLVIAKMVQQDANAPFNVWTRESMDASRPVRDLAVVAMDEGKETRRWVYRNAYILSVTFSDFDTSSSELVEEQVTIKADHVDEIWP